MLKKECSNKSTENFQRLIGHILSDDTLPLGLSAVPRGRGDESELAEAFLRVLCGQKNAHYKRALRVLEEGGKPGEFLLETSLTVSREISAKAQNDPAFAEWLAEGAQKYPGMERKDKINLLRRLFFPEGQGLDAPELRASRVEELRRRRTVTLTRLNARPIRNPLREMLFTANLLLTTPLQGKSAARFLPRQLLLKVDQVTSEEQKYWYDHPIPLGIAPEKNEALYGLGALNSAVAFEKKQGVVPQNEVLTVVLSASVTHEGLHGLTRPYFLHLMERYGSFPHLRLFIFTENDTRRMLSEVLLPLADYFGLGDAAQLLPQVFGVDGEYGRHYSFLKAVSAIWQVFEQGELRATFKIDLDQVFPQKELLKFTGQTAFQHFSTPLWGAVGRDALGNEVELGMIAGALVNQEDISQSLFTPDVKWPAPGELSADEYIFFSRLPQALSTEAEMMMRYELHKPRQVLQRVHVTGGTNGILVDALRRYRPFTPSIIGRAEDQAYLLSVLFGDRPHLRYLHQDGLIMRHDKNLFAGEAIRKAQTGKIIGDYVRTLLFSEYARSLPWPADKIKEQIDPFTGCFVSAIPRTVTMLRFVFKYFDLEGAGEHEQAVEFFRLGVGRLHKLFADFPFGSDHFRTIFNRERRAWNGFYDILQKAEEGLVKGDGFVNSAKQKMQQIIAESLIQ